MNSLEREMAGANAFLKEENAYLQSRCEGLQARIAQLNDQRSTKDFLSLWDDMAEHVRALEKQLNVVEPSWKYIWDTAYEMRDTLDCWALPGSEV